MGCPRGCAVHLLGAAALGYVAGGFPSADLAARLATGGATDLRTSGSNNPGAANAIAVLGPRWGYAVLAADVAKAALACRAGGSVAGGTGANVAGVAAVVGHCFPFHARFRGGKGVAASAGQCLATFPAYFPIDLAVAGITGVLPWWRRRAFSTLVVSSAIWVGAAVVWWRRGWPNLWGPPPTVALPLAAMASSAVIISRFRAATPAPGAAAPRPDGVAA